MQKPFHKKNSFGTNLSQTYNKFYPPNTPDTPLTSRRDVRGVRGVRGGSQGCVAKPRFVINQSSFFLINCSIFYFLPFWAVAFPINFFIYFYYSYINLTTRLNIFDLFRTRERKFVFFDASANFFKPSIFFSNYRQKRKNSIISNCKELDNIQFITILFPFVFSFSLLIRSRYKEQFFSYFVNETLPGFCLPYQNISWETFNEITSKKIVLTQKFEQSFDSSFGRKEASSFFCVEHITDIETSPTNILTSHTDPRDAKQTPYTPDTSPNISNGIRGLLPFTSPNIPLQTEGLYQMSGLLPREDFCFATVSGGEDLSVKGCIRVVRESSDVKEVLLEGDVKMLESDVNDISMLEEDVDQETTFRRLTPRNQQNDFAAPNLENKSGEEGTKKNSNSASLDLIEGLDIYSNLILLEMKPVWEQQQKQLYIGFLPKKKEIILKKLPIFSHTYIAKKGPFAFSDFTNPFFFTQKQNVLLRTHSKETNFLFVKGSEFAHQIKNNKLATFYPFKLYARKPSFFSFSKSGVSLKKKSIDQGFKLNNIFSKQYFQQKFVDLDELPLKLDQNSSIDSDQTSLGLTKAELLMRRQPEILLFNFAVKHNLVNSSYVKEVKETFSLFSDSGVTSVASQQEGMSAIKNQKKDQQLFASYTSYRGVKQENNLTSHSSVADLLLSNKTENFVRSTISDGLYLILPFKSQVSSRLLSGYRFPDTERMQLNSLFIQNLYKNIIFQKNNKKNLKIIIQVPSSFVYDFLNENNRQLNFHYLPKSQTLLNKVLAEKSNIGGIYQKVFTAYKADQTRTPLLTRLTNQRVENLTSNTDKNVRSKVSENSSQKRGFLTPLLAMSNKKTIAQSGRQSWEPVTLQSWLAITKFSFAFFVLKFLQYFYTTYGRDSLIVVLRFLDENLKERLGLSNKKKNKGYRLIKKVKKAFKDVAGIDNILLELSEMVWFLRNSGKGYGAVNKSKAFDAYASLTSRRDVKATLKFGNLLPKGFLFVGPPGTGKTFLVQAIAGEAKVPVLVQSGSSLTDAGENEKGAQRLKSLFEKARQLAPCIVFIDEIDTLGETRQNVMATPDAQQGVDDLIQSLQKYNQSSNTTALISPTNITFGDVKMLEGGKGDVKMSGLQTFKLSTKKSGNKTEKSDRSNIKNSENLQDTQKNREKQKANTEQLSLLMQLLIELDGLKSRKGVLVIGATNRPKVLDPALTRPGRFEGVLNLEFPGKKQRIEILKLYSQNIGLALPSASFSTSPSCAKQTSYFTDCPPAFMGQGQEDLSVYDVKMSDKNLSFFKETSLDSSNKNLKSMSFPPLLTLYKSVRSASQLNSFLSPKVSKATFFEKKGWEYLANRTFGFSAADLAAAMNQSSIQAILRKTGHTIETIEQGIEFITSYSIEKPKIESEKNQETFCCLTSDTSNTSDTPLTSLRDVRGVRGLVPNRKDVKKDRLKRVLSGATRKAGLEANIDAVKSKTYQSPMSDIGSIVNEKQKSDSKSTFLAPSFVEQEDPKQKLAKENKTILQVPFIVFNVKLPKALLSFAPNTDISVRNVTLTPVDYGDAYADTFDTPFHNITKGYVRVKSVKKAELLLATKKQIKDVKGEKKVLWGCVRIKSRAFVSPKQNISYTDKSSPPNTPDTPLTSRRDVRGVRGLLLTPLSEVSIRGGSKPDIPLQTLTNQRFVSGLYQMFGDVKRCQASGSVNQNKEKKDPFFITRIAYYQAGKAVLHRLIPEHPDAIVLKLWPQPKNSRHKDANFQLTSIDHRAKLETRLIGLYAGKAAELLFLCLNSHIKKENLLLPLLRMRSKEKIDFSLYEKRNLCHSNLGIDELSVASNLANSLVDKWFFYSNKTTLRKENQIFTNQNILEFSKIEVVDLFQQLTEEVQNLVSASNISETSMRDGREKVCRSNFQEWSIRPWWQNQITKETGILNMFYGDWYRIYLPDPQERGGNEEWVVPDEYYHNTQNLKNLLPFFGRKQSNQGNFNETFVRNSKKQKKITFSSNIAFGDLILSDQKSCFFLQTHSQKKRKKQKNLVFENDQTQKSLYVDITWNDLYKIDRDYIYQALILSCFNKAFSLLDDNRELLDYLADYLMRFERLRQHKIEEIFCDFGNLTSNILQDVRSNVTQVNFYKVENRSFSAPLLTNLKQTFGSEARSGFVSEAYCPPKGEKIFASQQYQGEKNILKEKQKRKFVFDKKWGINSRRNFSNFFNFDLLIRPTASKGYLASKFANSFSKKSY